MIYRAKVLGNSVLARCAKLLLAIAKLVIFDEKRYYALNVLIPKVVQRSFKVKFVI